MTTSNFSIEDLANSLIGRLDRQRIFPPYYDNPESFVSSATLSNTSSSCRRPRRPPNAFLLCRKNVHQEAKRRGTCNMRVISKVTGILWRNASVEEKEVYERLADQVNEIHVQRHTVLNRQQLQQQHTIGGILPPSCITTTLRPMAYKPYQIPSPPIYHNTIDHKGWQFPSPPVNYSTPSPPPPSYKNYQIPSPPHSNNLLQFPDHVENDLPAFTQDQNQLFTYYYDLLAPQ